MRLKFALGLACVLAGAGVVLAAPPAAAPRAAAVNYDIVYVRQPRAGDSNQITWPEVFHPGTLEPGSKLMLLHPNGAEETLVDTTAGAVTDPFVSFDALWVYYSFFPNVLPAGLNTQRGNLPYAGSDIYRINLQSRQTQRLTFQEFTPNTGDGHWDESNPVDPPDPFNRLGYGILNMSPAPLAGGKIVFTSSRNGLVPTKDYTFPTLQLFVMDTDGANVTPIAPMTLGSVLHPTPLRDGRIMFSTYESQGLRDQRLWGIWTIQPDGRHWQPLVSAFKDPSAFHFATQLSNDDIVVEDYYNLNNFGFGAFYRFPLSVAGQPAFYPADLDLNPPISRTIGDNLFYPFQMSFTRRGLYSITPFTNGDDEASPFLPDHATRAGKFTQPSAAPNNDLLLSWSPGPVNALTRPTDVPAVDAGLYRMPGGGPISAPSQLVLIKNDPNYNEVWPRAVLPYAAIHGDAQPAEFAWLPNDGSVHAALPAGTPYGLVGTSSLYKRESFPGYPGYGGSYNGLDAFNTSLNDASSNWIWQGADDGKYTNADIWAIRILALEGNPHRSYGPNAGQHFFNNVNEKLRILGEIPVRKSSNGSPLLDPEGNPDTSFLAKLPANTPFTFQTLDRNGLVLNMAQTWHQVRPGEMRADCGGCHAHSQQPLPFEQTAASKPDYAVWDLAQTTPLVSQDITGTPTLRTVITGAVNIEFYRDIRPILQASCVSCHAGSSPAGNLKLDDLALYSLDDNSGQEVPGDYARLCNDSGARWGYPPLVTVGSQPVWRQTNASRYVRPFQSRRSLLIWKVFGARLDGWTNADHPTESTPGDASTLPPGAQIDEADLDFTGAIMPPPGGGVPALSIDQKMTFARWVDLGCPINTGQGTADENFGWFVDDNRPTLTISAPRPGSGHQPLSVIRLGAADADSGIQPGSLSLTATFSLNGRPPGAQLADLAVAAGDGIYVLTPTVPLNNLAGAHLFAQVADRQGNLTRIDQKFSVLGNGVFLPAVVH